MPPRGTVELTGVLVPSEEGEGPDETGTVGAIDVAAIGDALRRPPCSMYLQLEAQTPPQPGEHARDRSHSHRLSEGPHLSYAVQWFLFASIALIGFADPRAQGGP